MKMMVGRNGGEGKEQRVERGREIKEEGGKKRAEAGLKRGQDQRR